MQAQRCLARSAAAALAQRAAAVHAAASASASASGAGGSRRRRRTATSQQSQQPLPPGAGKAAPAPGAPTARAPPPPQPQPQQQPAAELGPQPASHPLLDAACGWVVFSDLHVSPRSIDTAVAVLQRVHAEARARGAGVLFLGDFWDRRGDLPVVPLNRVQQELAGWSVPLLMLSGNHDQVDLGGLDHSLAPLQVAAPVAHVFTQPTLYRGALWLPYRRDESALRGVIARAQQAGPLKAIFGHADVATAHYNAAHQARDGVPPWLFPRGVPVFLGHYHFPHRVAGSAITYVGSPYQVSKSEAGQRKRLLLLDTDWQEVGEVPLDLGRRFFSFTLAPPGPPSNGASASADELADNASSGDSSSGGGGQLLSAQELADLSDSGQLREGDVACVVTTTAEEPQLAALQAALRQKGVQLQLQLQPPSRPAARIESAEQLSMASLLETYAANNGVRDDVLAAAREALKELGARSSEAPRHSHLQLSSVSVEGFGPFKSRVSYPLAARGLVAVTGRNEDDAASVSNGAGKTSLLTALLWAFKAPDGRGIRSGSEYVNEASRTARVTVEGLINGEPFTLTRAASRSKSSLALCVGGVELTKQEQRLTELELEARFSASLLPKTLVFTQEGLLSLLQSGDAAFKEMLSCIVDTDAWAAAREVAAQRSTEADRQRLAAGAMLGQLTQMLGQTQEALQQGRAQQVQWEQQHRQQQEHAQLAEQRASSELLAAAAESTQLQQALQVALTAGRAREVQLQGAIAAAHEAGTTAAAALEARQAQQQQQDGGSQAAPQQQQQPQLPPDFDWAAAERQLQPLLAVEQHAAEQLRQQQGITQQLMGQLQAARQRLEKYTALTTASSSGSGGGRGGGGGGRAAVTAAAVAASAGAGGKRHRHSRSSSSSSSSKGLQPVCDQCLQPISLDLYNSNLESLASEAGQLEQDLAASRDAEHQRAAALAAAQQQRQALRQAHDVDATAARQARERAMAEQTAAARRAAAALAEQRRLEQQQWQEQQRLQQAVWEEERQLQGELSQLQQLLQALAAARSQLRAKLQYVAGKLQLPELARGDSSGSSAGADASAGTVLWPQLHAGVADLCRQAQQLTARVEAAADGVVDSRQQLQQLAGLACPFTAQVQLLATQLEQQTTQQEQQQARHDELVQQVATWRQVAAAFGRTGIPSFLLEGVLGELQAATQLHLAQLAAGMTLQLSATTTAGKAAAAAKRGAGGRGKRAASSSSSSAWQAAAVVAAAGAAGAAPWDTAVLTSSTAASSAASSVDGGDSASASAAAAEPAPLQAQLREEISKRVFVGAGGELRERSVSQLSGGERKRLALALGLGFAEVAAARGRLTSNVLVLDEVLEKLDEEGVSRVACLLKGLPYSSVFVVGQAGSFVVKEFGAVDTVVKAGGAARVELGGGGEVGEGEGA